MRQIFAIMINTFREAVRSKLLHAVLLFSLLVIIASAVFGSVSIGEQFRVVKSFGYALVSLSGAICTILAGVSLFQKEISQKTIYNILSKSVSRTQFLIGKLLGLILTSSVLVCLMTLMVMVFVYPMEGKFDVLFFQGLYVMILEISIIASLTMFFSSLSVTPVVPGLSTFVCYLAGKSSYYLYNFINDDELNNGFSLVKIVVEWIVKIIPDLHMLTPYDRLLYGHSITLIEGAHFFIYSMSYVFACFMLTNLVFNRRSF